MSTEREAQPCLFCGVDEARTLAANEGSQRAALAEKPAPQGEPVARDLARTLLWVAYVWNDHNFEAAHIEARRVAQRNGIHSLDDANTWLTAAQEKPMLDDATMLGVVEDVAALRANWEGASDTCSRLHRELEAQKKGAQDTE